MSRVFTVMAKYPTSRKVALVVHIAARGEDVLSEQRMSDAANKHGLIDRAGGGPYQLRDVIENHQNGCGNGRGVVSQERA